MEPEERIAWLEREVEGLSATVAAQDAELRALRAAVDRLTRAEAERQADAAGGVVMGDERPPHW
ncbi:MAG: SlyX family protein [Hasllibacter sp.]